MVENFPKFFTVEEGLEVCRPVSLDEIKEVLHHFGWEKSPCPDAWTVEFYIYFFDLLGDELQDMVEESRLTRKFTGALNSTFIYLIPKVEKLDTFQDFRSISLCNLAYKLIAKMILNRLKPCLGKWIKKEQSGFLESRKIIDAIGIT